MRNAKVSRILVILLIAISTSILYAVRLSNANTTYEAEGTVLLCCNVFMWGCLAFIVSGYDFYVFEPIVFVFFLYYMIFVFQPINNIVIDNVTEFGVNTMKGCIKATLIFMGSFVCMLLGYYGKPSGENAISGKYIRKTEELNTEGEDDTYDKDSLLIYSWVLWFVGIAGFLIYNILVGRSAIYMLSFGLLGRGNLGSRGYDVLILSMIVYLSFYPLMNIITYGRNNILKVLALAITCAPLATRGFRNVLVVVLSGPVLYHYIKRKKTPSAIAAVLFFCVFVFIFGFIGATRGATRIGRAVDLSTYEYTDGLDGILYYFDSYKVFYGAVMQYPQNYSYTNGIQLLYTIIMFIPRFIWSGKPDTPIREVIGRSTGPLSQSGGSAWPNIGEYYTDLGIIGTFVCMLVLGVLLRKMKGMYQGKQNSSARMMLYCLFLPALVTIIAYGYTAGNMPQYLLMALPYIIQKYFVKRSS